VKFKLYEPPCSALRCRTIASCGRTDSSILFQLFRLTFPRDTIARERGSYRIYPLLDVQMLDAAVGIYF